MIKKILQILVNNLVWYSGLLISYMPKREDKITKTLCIVRTDAISDLVLFTPSLKYVREKYDGFKITLVIQNQIEELVENCPCIDSIISFNEKK